MIDKRPGLWTYPDGREVCLTIGMVKQSLQGRKEYRRRIQAMWDRQNGICCLFGRIKECPGPLRLEEATFEHENGRGGGKRDDRIEVDGKWINGTSRANILTLTQVSSNVRVLPEVLEAAQTQSEEQFIANLTQNHNQALERKVTLKMTYPAPDADKVRAKLSEKAVLLGLEPDDYAGALLGWVIDDDLESQ